MNGPYELCSGYIRMFKCPDKVNMWIHRGGGGANDL